MNRYFIIALSFFSVVLVVTLFISIIMDGTKTIQTNVSSSDIFGKRNDLRNCEKSSDCGEHSQCVQDGPDYFICQCDSGWIDHNDKSCSYRQRDKLTAFLLSFFVGGLGIDWFYLCRKNAGYIVGGIFKLLTLGGCGVWWLVDWIRILADAFPDGNGFDLRNW